MGVKKILIKQKRSRSAEPSPRSHLLLLLIWILLGAFLRFSHLAAKPPWADEWATLVFSLGNSFLTVPLENIISLDTLMQPLQLKDDLSLGDVVDNLLSESTHPPVYFVLTHLWIKLFSTQGGLVSITVARSLSALLGVMAIPAIFALSNLVAESLVFCQIAAALMAFSPYGVYLAQETRHYTLAILLIMASVACLLVAIKCLKKKQALPLKIVLFWIVINSLGVATHYFFALALVTEVLVLGIWLIKNNKYTPFSLQNSPWRGISLAILGTVAGCSVWIWTWLNIPNNQLTDWTKHGNPLGSEFLEPIGRIIAWITTMILLLPIEGTSQWITVLSVIIVILVMFLLLKMAIQYFKTSAIFLVRDVIYNYIISAIGLIFCFVYLGDRDLTLAARFQFFYFPVVLILVAAILDYCWQKKGSKQTKNIVIIVLAIAFCGSLSVVNNYAYQKPDRSDLVVPVIREAQQENPAIPVLIATVHKTHEQTGEMMGIAWEWLKQIDSKVTQPKFILLHKKQNTPEQDVTNSLRQQLAKLDRPFDIWVVNFSVPTGLKSQNCLADLDYKRRVSGYRYRLFHCQ